MRQWRQLKKIYCPLITLINYLNYLEIIKRIKRRQVIALKKPFSSTKIGYEGEKCVKMRQWRQLKKNLLFTNYTN